MPLPTLDGQYPEVLELKGPELARKIRLEALDYPRDAEQIFHLTPLDMRDWLYLQDPKKALILMSTCSIREKIQIQLKPSLKKLWVDFLWRLCH